MFVFSAHKSSVRTQAEFSAINPEMWELLIPWVLTDGLEFLSSSHF